jgi:ATP-dependent protease ClpP protease subunit
VKILILTLLLWASPAFATQIVLDTKNTVNFRGAVTAESVSNIMLELAAKVMQRGNQKYTIYLVLDSPGGSVAAGFAFITFAKTLRNVETISIYAASMGSAIQQALPGKRWTTEDGLMMFHRAAGRFEGQFNEGEVETQLRLWKAVVERLEKVNADRMEMQIADYKAAVKDELWYFGDEAVKNKAADGVATILCSARLINSRESGLAPGFFWHFGSGNF